MSNEHLDNENDKDIEGEEEEQEEEQKEEEELKIRTNHKSPKSQDKGQSLPKALQVPEWSAVTPSQITAPLTFPPQGCLLQPGCLLITPWRNPTLV